MSVDIIIVHYKDNDSLQTCLQALSYQTVQPTQLIIVDNSQDLAQLNTTLKLNILKPDYNMGFAAACNLAAKQSQSEWLALLNADAFADPHWLEELLNFAKEHKSSYLTSKQLMYHDPNLLDGTGDSYYFTGLYRRRGHKKPASTAYPAEVFSASGAAMMIKRTVFQDAGGFDERFFAYGEDVDLGFRLRLQAYSCLYCEQAVVYHKGYSTSGGRHSDFSLYYGHRNLVWVYVKNMPLAFLLLFLPIHIALNIVTLMLFTKRAKGRIIFKAKWHALKELPTMIRSRKAIQAKRKISLLSLWNALNKSLK